MSELEVHVPRQRPVCPYCKDEVVHGHVWVCPGCEAAHHDECAEELGTCAACGPPDARRGASTSRVSPKGVEATPARVEESSTDGLAVTTALQREELERLGFVSSAAAPDDFLGPGLRIGAGAVQSCKVRVRRVDVLTVERLEADWATALREANPFGFGRWNPPVFGPAAVWFYRVGRVTPEAGSWIAAGKGRLSFFAVAQLVESQELIQPRRVRFLGAAIYPVVCFLAHRLAHPELDPAVSQRLAGSKAWLGVVAVLMTLVALLIALLLSLGP